MAILTTGSNSSQPRLFISSYYTIIGQSIFFKFETPTNIDPKNNIKTIELFTGESEEQKNVSRIILDLDPNTPILDNIRYTYDEEGTYFVSYEVTYVNNTKQIFYLETPIRVYKEWPKFNQENIRLLGENILELPYTFDQIRINPNEFGVESIYNNSLKKLHDCLEYLKSNTRILNTKTPSFYYGWLGVNKFLTSSGFSWHTLDYKFENDFYKNPSESVNPNRSFRNIKDISETNSLIYILDGQRFRIFKNSNVLREIIFDNRDEILETLTNIVSFDISDDGKIVYLLDSAQNKVYRIDIDFDFTNSLYETYNPMLSLTLNIGSYGDETDPFTFNNPTELVYTNKMIYVLDYNNQCVKVYNEKLEWIYTCNPIIFKTDIPISITVHPTTRFLYVLTEKNVYVFSHKKRSPQSVFSIQNIQNLKPKKIFFDEAGEFFYILTENGTTTKNSSVFKYTALGLYMDFLEIPELKYVTGKKGKNRNILLAGENCIIKCQEVTDILRTGEGLDINYWSLNQILLKKDEMVQDLVLNRSLSRISQNIINFRNSLESKLEISRELTPAGEVSYFRLYPVKANTRPNLGKEIENNEIAVGVNELHVPSVINREFQKIYDALLKIKKFLDIEIITTESEIGRNLEKCKSPFCWSWKAMSTYNVKKPIIRTCNINPVSFRELRRNFPTTYVQTKSWDDATSPCCSNVKTPLG
jgi:DNA-binding beta-propeller fold protein YncE